MSDQDSGTGIGRAAGVMAFGTLLSRLTGVMRLWAFSLLGVSILTDTYLFANNTPNLIYELVVGGVLSSTLVPIFVGLVRTPDGERSIDAIATLGLVVVAALSALLYLGAPAVMRVLIDGSKPALQREFGVDLLRMFAPQILAYGFISIATSLLNARGRFAAPMFVPIINNVVVTGVFIIAARMVDDLQSRAAAIGAAAETGGLSGDALDAARFDLVRASSSVKLLLGLGTTAGIIAMAVLLGIAMVHSGTALRFRWAPGDVGVRDVIGLAGWTMGYVIANQVALIFIQRVASRADGEWSAYNLANNTFFLLPHGVLAVSIITATQPELARAFLDRRRRDFRRLTENGIQTIMTVIVPAAVVLFVLARPLASLVLQHGNTSADDAERIAIALRAFVIGLPGFSVYLFLMSALKALRDTQATFTVNVWENAMNIVFVAVLWPWIGLRGLALSFTLAYLLAALVALSAVGRRIGGIGGNRLLAGSGSVVAAALAMGVAIEVVRRLVTAVLLGSDPLLGLFIGNAFTVGAAGVAGVTVYALIGRQLGVREIESAASALRRRLGR
jgi:putative peptidoglycan lipid II flippase